MSEQQFHSVWKQEMLRIHQSFLDGVHWLTTPFRLLKEDVDDTWWFRKQLAYMESLENQQ